MRVVSLNVNGIRAAHAKGLVSWLAAVGADVVCLQEVRALPGEIPAEVLALEGYSAHWNCAARKGYSGVGLITRLAPDRVVCGTGHGDFDPEGRVIRADFGSLSLLSVYVPSGSSGSERQSFKMLFLEHLLEHLAGLVAEGRDLVICGDFNVAHRPVDLKNWRANATLSGFLPEERAWVDRLLECGLVDTHRALVGPEAAHYTWWSSRGRARDNDVGWRLDYQFSTPNLAALARDARVYRERFFSDHAPVIIDYDHG